MFLVSSCRSSVHFFPRCVNRKRVFAIFKFLFINIYMCVVVCVCMYNVHLVNCSAVHSIEFDYFTCYLVTSALEICCYLVCLWVFVLCGCMCALFVSVCVCVFFSMSVCGECFLCLWFNLIFINKLCAYEWMSLLVFFCSFLLSLRRRRRRRRKKTK